MFQKGQLHKRRKEKDEDQGVKADTPSRLRQRLSEFQGSGIQPRTLPGSNGAKLNRQHRRGDAQISVIALSRGGGWGTKDWPLDAMRPISPESASRSEKRCGDRSGSMLTWIAPACPQVVEATANDTWM